MDHPKDGCRSREAVKCTSPVQPLRTEELPQRLLQGLILSALLFILLLFLKQNKYSNTDCLIRCEGMQNPGSK